MEIYFVFAQKSFPNIIYRRFILLVEERWSSLYARASSPLLCCVWANPRQQDEEWIFPYLFNFSILPNHAARVILIEIEK